jgi:Co/Zn/Cd efflux system component
MFKSDFLISKMDCAAEEQMIRMKLDGMQGVQYLDFDLSNRTLSVYHNEDISEVKLAIGQLHLNDKHLGTQKADLPEKSKEATQKKVLWWVLGINFGFFIIEMTTGLISNSLGLVADSLDMLADSIVYGLSLMAVGSTLLRKKKVAKASGYFQIVLALFGFVEVIRRFVGFEEMPVFEVMIVVSIFALVANSVSLYLIQKTKSKEAHMQASMIFTSNDIIINAGVILAGVMVYFTASKLPDLIIGGIIFLIVMRGALRILKL